VFVMIVSAIVAVALYVANRRAGKANPEL